MQSLRVYNNDVVDTKVVRIEFFWDYAEDFGAFNGYNNLNVDWFKWRGSYMGEGQGGTRDYDSSTVWSGNLSFNAGSSNKWEIDFDNDWGGGGRLTDVQNSDFGFVMDFQNGCQLVRNPGNRALYTWTPSPTPSITPTFTPPPPPTSTSLPTMTPLPTNTLPPSSTPTASSTPTITLTPSNTPIPTITPWPTSTPVPTATPNSVIQTATAAAWTPTSLPTAEATPTPFPTFPTD
jgi:hypothetical protein